MKLKKNTLRLLGVIALGSISLSSIGLVNLINPQEEQIAYAWSGEQTPNYSSNYYSRVEGLTGQALLRELGEFNKPKSPSYDWSRYEAADEMEGDSSSIFCIYTRTPKKKSAHCGNYAWERWNREHICPQGRYPRSDADNHNIYACEGQINNYRSSLNFNDVKDSGGKRLSVFGHQLDCYKTSSYFEPPEESKGEVARAVMYCSVYYGYKLTELFPSEEKCLEWHFNDPVDNRDIFRNNTVATLQGNRNPFVDHPEYANAIWGDGSLVPGKATIKFNESYVSLEEDEKVTNRATIRNGTGDITYSVKDSNIANISSVGVIKGIKAGQTEVYAKAVVDGEDLTATCKVVVTKPIELISLTMSKTSLTLEKGAKVQLNVTPNPKNANANVTWSSSNPDIASVTNGFVKGLKEGKSTITATSTKDPKIKATCEVIVTKASEVQGFKKVTEDKADYTGEYVIGFPVGKEVRVLKPSSRGEAPNTNSYPLANDVIGKEAKADSIKIEKAGNDSYYLSINDKEVLTTKEKNGLSAESKTIENAVTIKLDSSNNINIKASNGSTLKFNEGWGNFRFYKSGQSPICLYEKSGSDQPIDPNPDTSEPDVPSTSEPDVPSTSNPDIPEIDPTEKITLKQFNDYFLETITCDGKGAMTGVYNGWEIMEQRYNQLNEDDKIYLLDATIKDETVGKAVERYDYIVAKYGVEKFPNFMGREIVKEAQVLTSINTLGVAEITIISILGIAIVATSIIGVVYLLKAKKEKR